MTAEFSRFRAHFPGLGRALFLNHASETPMSTPVRQMINQYLDVAETDPDAAPAGLAPLREQWAALFGGEPDEYAAVPNTATGLGLVAAGLPWHRGDNVVLPEEEYPANVYPWLLLRDRGVEIRRVPLVSGLRVDPDQVAARVDRRTRVVAVSAVEYLSGFRCDLAALSRIAREQSALFVVDAIQAAGAVPVHVEADGIDVMAAGGYKWLMGPVGTGFLYVRRGLWPRIRPVLPGARSSVGGSADSAGEFQLAGSAQRFESGNLPYALFHGWRAGLSMLAEAGLGQIHSQILSLTDHLIGGLQERGLEVTSPVAAVGERSGIVSFSAGSASANEALAADLYRQGIVIAVRGGRCRVSPHFYNSQADIDKFLEAMP